MSACIFCGCETGIVRHRVNWIRFSGDAFHTDRNQHNPSMRSCAHSLTVPMCEKHHNGLHNYDIRRIGDYSSRFRELSNEQVTSGFKILEDAMRLSWLIPLVDVSLIGKDYFEVSDRVGSYYTVIEMLARSAEFDREPIVHPQMFGMNVSPRLKSLSFERPRGDYMTEIVTTRGDFVRHTSTRLLISKSTSGSYMSDDYILKHVDEKRKALYNGSVMFKPVKNMKTPIRKSEITNILNDLVHEDLVDMKVSRKNGRRYPVRSYRYVGDV